MPKFLITNDLHLTDDPKDEYRWGIFKWLGEQVEQHNVEDIFILGDLTDKKDNHSSRLVNRLTGELIDLAGVYQVTIHLLLGNHDCTTPNEPFFEFLDYNEFINYYITWRSGFVQNSRVLMLPHSRDIVKDWEEPLHFSQSQPPDYIFMHQTFTGARASNGSVMEGTDRHIFDGFHDTLCVSGDIHVPQSVGKIVYTGSPYHIRFGDAFKPRVLLIEGKKMTDLHFPTMGKYKLEIREPGRLRELDYLKPGDQVKVTLRIPQSQAVDWPKLKAEVAAVSADLGLDLRSVGVQTKKRTRVNLDAAQQKITTTTDYKTVFDRFCSQEKLDASIKELGEGLL